MVFTDVVLCPTINERSKTSWLFPFVDKLLCHRNWSQVIIRSATYKGTTKRPVCLLLSSGVLSPIQEKIHQNPWDGGNMNHPACLSLLSNLNSISNSQEKEPWFSYLLSHYFSFPFNISPISCSSLETDKLCTPQIEHHPGFCYPKAEVSRYNSYLSLQCLSIQQRWYLLSLSRYRILPPLKKM